MGDFNDDDNEDSGGELAVYNASRPAGVARVLQVTPRTVKLETRQFGIGYHIPF